MSTSLNLIEKRRKMVNETSQSVYRPNIDNIQSPISLNMMETFLTSINNHVDVNYFGTSIFDKYNTFSKDNADKPNYVQKIQNMIVDNIIPKYDDLNSLKSYCKSKDLPFVDTIQTYIFCDRVLKNDSIINKRFNINKFVETNLDLETCEIVNSLCEFIDTYDIPPEAKLNLALENIPYALKRSSISNFGLSEITDCISEYFLMRESVLTDTYIRKMKKVFESCPFIDKEDVNPYIFKSNNYFGNRLSKKMNISVQELLSLNTERKVSDFIHGYLCEATSGYLNYDQYQDRINTILALPLTINVSASFMESQILNYSCLLKEDQSILKDILTGSLHQYDNGLNDLKFLSELNSLKEKEKTNVQILESELDDKDIKDLFKKFKAEQNKDMKWFRRLINKLYAKTPEEIIDGFPHVLGIIRGVFVLSPIVVPYIGPLLVLFNSIIDRLISLHINRKQTEKIAKYIDSEKKRMEEKLDSLDGEKKKKTEEYIKNLDKCYKKIENYSSSELGGYIDSSDDSDDDDDFDFDFDLESCINSVDIKNISLLENKKYSQESFEDIIKESLYYQESLQNILENKNQIQDFIYRNIETIVENHLYAFSNMIVNCPISIDYNWFSETVKDYVYDLSCESYTISMSDINKTLNLAKEEKMENGMMRNILIESETINAMKSIITEGIKISDIKLTFKNLKSKIKDLSTKEKSVCQSIDAQASTFLNSVEKAIKSDRREAIIKGSLIPSFSRTLKLAFTFSAISIVNPIVGLISIMGYLGTSKYLNRKERLLIYDEIDTELKVVEKELQMAENDGDMKRYRFMLQYEKKLIREKQRIRYGMRVSGQRIPMSASSHNDD